jgi:CBS domain containing-hemolysin-like protein
LSERLRLEFERGVETFSLVKHSLLVVLGLLAVVIFVDGRPLGPRPVLEALAGSWTTMLVCAYAVPQLLYRRTDGRWLAPFTPVLRVLAAGVRPLVAGLQFLKSLADLGEQEQQEEEPPTAAENIQALLTAGTEEGLIEESDRELIQSVVAFGDKTVREVMTPRPDIVAITAGATLDDLRRLVQEQEYSRLPVFTDNLDNIVGLVVVKDLIQRIDPPSGKRLVSDIMRPAAFVPETKRVADVLREFQTGRFQLAIVVDEYGGTAGLVTVEDVVEELVGEIRDEYDLEAEPVVREKDDSYVFSGKVAIGEMVDRLGLEIDDGGFETVGGYVLTRVGRVPAVGERFAIDGLDVEILEAERRRIHKVRLRKLPTPAAEGAT